MAEVKRFTAEEARAMMPSKKRVSGFEILLHHTYRNIKGAAVANKNFVYINTSSFLGGAIVNVLNVLKEDGYSAEYDYSANRITVRW